MISVRQNILLDKVADAHDIAGHRDVVLDAADALHIRGDGFRFLPLLLRLDRAGQGHDTIRGVRCHRLVLQHRIVRQRAGNGGLQIAIAGALARGRGSRENPKAGGQDNRARQE